MSKNIKILLSVSLLLNVLVIGAGAGMVYKKWSEHSWASARQDLEPETRNLVGRTFQSAFRDIRPLGNKARRARADMVKILSAKEFDAEKFDLVAQRLSKLSRQIRDKKIEATKAIALQLSAEERRKMAKRMTDMIGGGHEKRVHRKRRPERMERKAP